MILRTAPALLLVVPLAAIACSVYDAPTCHVGADCISGVCNGDGTCAPANLGTGGGSGTSSSSTAGTGASSSGSTGSAGGPACLPNHDGIVSRDEVPLAAGYHANFRAAENAQVSTAGTMNGDGTRTWDLTVTFSGDHAEPLQTLDVASQWFGKDFPGASYAAKLSDTSDLLGIFTLTSTALELVGVASPSSGTTQTELHYTPAVTVLSFPVKSGATWMTATTITGLAQGIAAAYTEAYQSSVDATGTLKTPYASFDVLRVNTLLTRNVGGLITTTRTFTFVTDCFGSVASIVSNTDELVTEFTTAAEVSRLAP